MFVLQAVLGWQRFTRLREILARMKARPICLRGARSADRLYFLVEECEKIATVTVATDDGSAGIHGRVTEALASYLDTLSDQERASVWFYNCGPAPMIHAAEAVQRAAGLENQIYSATRLSEQSVVSAFAVPVPPPDGRRICIDGPFITPAPAILNN